MEQKILHNISIIVAIAENNAIGKDNKLLWHISEDLKRFKRLTTGHTLIMGRNTFLSLPGGALPNRRHIVISDVAGEEFEGCEMARSIEMAISMAGEKDECFVIGGGMVYAQFLPLAGKVISDTGYTIPSMLTPFSRRSIRKMEGSLLRNC